MNDPILFLTGYVVLYLESGRAYVLHNAVYPTQAAALAAVRKGPIKNTSLNAVRVHLPRPEILHPPEG